MTRIRPRKKNPTVAAVFIVMLFVFPMIAFHIIYTVFFSVPSPYAAADTDTSKISVGFIYDSGYPDAEMTSGQLGVDPAITVTPIISDNISKLAVGDFDILVIAVSNFSAEFIDKAAALFLGGQNIIFLACNGEATYSSFYKRMGLIPDNASVSYISSYEESVLLDPVNDSDPLVLGIQWLSSPEAKKYLAVSSFSEGVIPVINGHGTDRTLIFRVPKGTVNGTSGSFIGFNIIYSYGANRDFMLWLYTPYFLYRCMKWETGGVPLTYYEWQGSPVPHLWDKFLIAGYIGFIFIIMVFIYLSAKRASRVPLEEKYKEELKNIARSSEPEGKDNGRKEESPQSHGPDRNETVESKETEPDINGRSPRTPNDAVKNEEGISISREVIVKKILADKWEEVGLHRQISSFFLQLFLGLLVALPYLLLTMYIYPRFVMPFPQTQGWVDWTMTFFAALFTVFDMGTSTALTKFFSQYRIKKPTESIKYAQIYIWWQMVTGCIQITLISILGIYVLGPSYLGHMTWFFVLSSLAQFPGMLNVILLMLEAMQRFDIKITLESVLGATSTNVVKYLTIIFFRGLFKYNYSYGEAFGAGVGMVVGDYFAQIVNFLICLAVFKKMGYTPSTLFRIDFGKEQLKTALGFGYKIVLGNVWVPLTSLLEITLISLYVLNYNAEMGYLAMMRNITSINGALGVFYSSMMPGISEAHGNNKMKLTEYYLIEGLKWTFFIWFFMLAVLASLGDRIIIAFAGPQWYGSIKYLPLLLIFASLEPLAWYADKVLQGTNNTKYNMYIWIIEQGTRSALLVIIFVGFHGSYLWLLYFAYIPGITAKDISAIIFIRRRISKFKLYPMHTLIGPAIASVALYGFILFLLNFWVNSVVITVILLFTGFFGGLYMYVFITGLVGAWDKNTLGEFEKALNMITTVKFMFIGLVKTCKFGYKLCPWKEKFAVDIYGDAEKEAKELTLEKELLII